uniref:BZIP domain-containing protein n=1 Tax=Corethron hystrix TaxID=216773 RepID=A0A6U5DXR0_9STRA|mmetsp:Transcript_1469/g.3070  ORF Transcript_1469/g.3070 Transcript_1469/m.3070 type:complete len:151 (+) Transcript_1469:143-595(+)
MSSNSDQGAQLQGTNQCTTESLPQPASITSSTETTVNKNESLSKESLKEKIIETEAEKAKAQRDRDQRLSEAEKKTKAQRDRDHRLSANREHAKASRKRKKIMIEDLQKTVVTLTNENQSLKAIQAQLQQELHMARSRSVRLFIQCYVSS